MISNKNGTTLNLAYLTSTVSLYAIIILTLNHMESAALILIWYISNFVAQVFCIFVLMGKYYLLSTYFIFHMFLCKFIDWKKILVVLSVITRLSSITN